MLFRWLKLREKLDSPGSSPLYTEAMAFARKCSRQACHGRDRSWLEHDGGGQWVCSACLQPWRYDLVTLPREVNGSRHGREIMVGECARLAAVLGHLRLWEKRIYLCLYLYENVGGYQRTAEEANRRWAAGRPRWTEWTVRRLIRQARARVEHHARIV